MNLTEVKLAFCNINKKMTVKYAFPQNILSGSNFCVIVVAKGVTKTIATSKVFKFYQDEGHEGILGRKLENCHIQTVDPPKSIPLF